MKTRHIHTISGASSKAKAHGSRAGATSPGVRALPDINTGHVQEGVPEVNGTCTHAQTHISRLGCMLCHVVACLKLWDLHTCTDKHQPSESACCVMLLHGMLCSVSALSNLAVDAYWLSLFSVPAGAFAL